MLDLIRVFDQVVESGSFSQAGKVLNMAPSSVARNIDSLEASIKTTLFKRSTRQIILTEEGQYFHQQSITLLRDTDKLLNEMRADNDTPEGMLRISVFESFGNLCLAPIIPEFLQLYPNIQIELDLNNHMVDLNSDNIDIAIRIGTPQDSGLKARKLLTNYTSLVASPRYIEQHDLIERPDDVQQHNCLLISHQRQRNHWFFSKGEVRKKVSVSGNFISKGGSPLLNAALFGSGLLLLSDWMVKSHLESKQLVHLLPEWTATHNENGSGDIYAIYKNSHYPKPHVRVFLDFLVSHQHLF
ncbi:MAG: LysR family transcriptional regulator [Aliivibrio sp.]|uniref:LysR family transcriptional regulator n=1 Tax=Aliivibrio sp. TaxID=1872443 RepID=UPI001A405A53|nr:LysR family transcriptional regulator [Aliivibrio sp.]